MSEPMEADMVESTYIQRLPPVNGYKHNTIQFVIQGQDTWVQLNEISLDITFKISQNNANKTPYDSNNGILALTADAPNVFPQDLLPHVYWKQLLVKINNQNLPTGAEPYYVSAYMQKLLGTSAETHKYTKRVDLYRKDFTGASQVPEDAVTPTFTGATHNDNGTHVPVVIANSGSAARRRFDFYPSRKQAYEILAAGTQGAGIFTCIKPYHFFLNQGKSLPPGINLTLEFTKAPAEVWLMSNEPDMNADLWIDIQDIVLNVPRQKLRPHVQVDIDRLFLTNNMRFPLLGRVQVTTHTIPQGVNAHTIAQIFGGPTPTAMVVGLVKQTEYQGALDGSFHNFENYNLSEIYVEKEGKTFPTNKYTKLNTHPNVNQNPYWSGALLEGYLALRNLGLKATPPWNIDITFEEYLRGGACLYAFDLTDNDNSGGLAPDVVNKTSAATVSIRLSFERNLVDAVNLVVLSTHNNSLEIDKIGRATWNFN